MFANTEPQMIGAGTYGCVFYPSVNVCNGKIEDDKDSSHYITKIQSITVGDEYYEIFVGKQVQTIPLYYLYFAPVVKSCKIKMTNMDYNLVKTCASLQNELGELNTKTYYISNKIRYVGTDTLVNYMNSWNKSPPTLYRKLINTHLHILEAIQKLYEKYIVHFDIKPQNIVHDDIQDIPIIIDFGLARDISPLFNPHINLADNDSLLHNIFVNHNSYAYWCIDIHILSNIGNKSLLKPTETVTTQQIKTIVAGFLTPNFEAMLSVEDIAQFKQNTLSYFSSYVDKEQTWQYVFSDLIQYYKSWDNYSAAMTYLYTYHKCAITTSSNNDGDSEIMHRYISILKNIIIDMPNTRPTAEQTRELILNLVSNNTN